MKTKDIETAGLSESRASSDMDDPNRNGGAPSKPRSEPKAKNDLDSHEKQQLFLKLKDWKFQELQRQAANRFQMALDEDYADGLQWSEEDAQELMARGQAPLVFNEIKPTVEWMIGTERRTRIDFKVLSRKKSHPGDDVAEAKTGLLKYLNDVNQGPFERSLAFSEAVNAGLGWLEVGVRGDPTDELLYTSAESWRNILHDSNSVKWDGIDMRYIFRDRWLDEDIGVAYFPERADIVKQSVVNSDLTSLDTDEEDLYYMGARVTEPGHDYPGHFGKYTPYSSAAYAGSVRSRVKFTECWYRVPILHRKFNNGEYQDTIFDKDNEEHINALRGGASLYDKLEMQVRCAIYCSGGLLYEGESPYDHGRFPFVPVWCYRRARDHMPYGVIRNLRDPQDDLNKRQSKALWILSTNSVEMEEGALPESMTMDDLRDEVARPDRILMRRRGYDLKVDRDTQLAEEHLTLMDRDVAHIRNVSGVNSENLGRQTNASSGVAITARQEQGSIVTTAPFDNLRYATQIVGQMQLAISEQFYSNEKTIRILGERGGVKYIELNKPQDDGSLLNDITAEQADYIVDEQEYRTSLHQAMFESLFDIVGRLAQMNPQVALNLLDMVVDIAPGLPNKKELIARIREINGQQDPDDEQSPEQLQAQQEQKAREKALTEKQQDLVIRDAEAKVQKTEAERDRIISQKVSEHVTAMYQALQAAGITVTVPGTAPVADIIMTGAGFNDPNIGQTAEIDQAAQARQLSAQPPQPQQPMDQGLPPPPMAGDGAAQGIETPAIDGLPAQ